MVVQLFAYEVYEFYWGAAVYEQRTGKWIRAFLRPNGQEINLEGLDVEVHENGIEFL